MGQTEVRLDLSMKVGSGSSWITVEVAQQCAKCRKDRKAPMHMKIADPHSAIFDRPICSLGLPSRDPAAHHPERSGTPPQDSDGANC